MADSLRPQQGANMMQQSKAVLSGTVDGVPVMSNVQTMLINNRKAILFLAGLLMFTGFISLMLWSNESPYRAVYSGMDEKDAAAIVELLQKEKIPYKLQDAGTVLVPEDQVYAVRLTLASADIAPGNGQGFELFDRANEFGVSDFTQKINLQRALQVELSRTIEVLPAVAAARVHLVMPKESAFAERDRSASASVMLKLTGNKHLPQQSVEAIQSLVASAVPELDKAAVTVVDSSGNMLSAGEQMQPSGEGQSMMDYKARLEQSYEVRLTSMLEQVVGSGQAIVRVSADINREHVESSAQIYNPDEQVLRSSKAIQENRQAIDATPMGVPGMASNNPDNIGADGAVVGRESPKEEASRSENTMNYEISSKTERRIIPFGTIEKLSIAVIVGGSSVKNEAGESNFVPRGAEALHAIENLVRNASGFDEDRGDTVEVQSMPLHDLSGASIGDMEELIDKSFYLELMRYGLGVLALALVAWFVMRPMAKRMASDDAAEQNQALGLDHNGEPLRGISESGLQMSKARAAILNDPNRASRVVQEWVS